MLGLVWRPDRAGLAAGGLGLFLLAACGDGSAARSGGQACTADCECHGDCCIDGACYPCGRRLHGLCGLQVTPGCPCFGGTCDERHCCVLPNGTIDPGGGPACTAECPCESGLA